MPFRKLIKFCNLCHFDIHIIRAFILHDEEKIKGDCLMKLKKLIVMAILFSFMSTTLVFPYMETGGGGESGTEKTLETARNLVSEAYKKCCEDNWSLQSQYNYRNVVEQALSAYKELAPADPYAATLKQLNEDICRDIEQLENAGTSAETQGTDTGSGETVASFSDLVAGSDLETQQTAPGSEDPVELIKQIAVKMGELVDLHIQLVRSVADPIIEAKIRQLEMEIEAMMILLNAVKIGAQKFLTAYIDLLNLEWKILKAIGAGTLKVGKIILQGYLQTLKKGLELCMDVTEAGVAAVLVTIKVLSEIAGKITETISRELAEQIDLIKQIAAKMMEIAELELKLLRWGVDVALEAQRKILQAEIAVALAALNAIKTVGAAYIKVYIQALNLCWKILVAVGEGTLAGGKFLIELALYTVIRALDICKTVSETAARLLQPVITALEGFVKKIGQAIADATEEPRKIIGEIVVKMGELIQLELRLIRWGIDAAIEAEKKILMKEIEILFAVLQGAQLAGKAFLGAYIKLLQLEWKVLKAIASGAVTCGKVLLKVYLTSLQKGLDLCKNITEAAAKGLGATIAIIEGIISKLNL